MGGHMKIVEVSNENKKEWDEYVLNHPESTFYHQFGWRCVIEETYGHKPLYLKAVENGEIVGLFPLFLMKSLLFGKRLISVPFGSYGGPLADNKKIYDKLIKKGQETAEKANVKFLEIRSNPNKKNDVVDNLDELSDHFVTFVMNLSLEKDTIWKGMNKKRRNAIRNAMKNELDIEINKGSIHTFYDIYSKNIKRLGTPVHSKHFFLNIQKYLSDGCVIFNVKKGKTIVASAFLLLFKDTVTSGWAGALAEYYKDNPNDFMYWKIIEHFQEEGFEKFDFGRATINSGVYDFKKKWRAQEIKLNYQYYLKRANIPSYDLSSSSASKFISIWKKIPLRLSKRIGPLLRKNIP